MKYFFSAVSILLILLLSTVSLSAQEIVQLKLDDAVLQSPRFLENEAGEQFFIYIQDGQFRILKSGEAGFQPYEADFKNYLFTSVSNPAVFNREGFDTYLFFIGEDGWGDQGIYALGFNEDGDLEIGLEGRLDMIPDLTGKIDFFDVRRESSYGFSVFFSKNNTLCEIYIADFTNTITGSKLFSYQGELISYTTLKNAREKDAPGYGSAIIRSGSGFGELVLWESDNSTPLWVNRKSIPQSVTGNESNLVFLNDKTEAAFYWYNQADIRVYNLGRVLQESVMTAPGQVEKLIPLTDDNGITFLAAYHKNGDSALSFISPYENAEVPGISGDILVHISDENLYFGPEGVECIFPIITARDIRFRHLRINPVQKTFSLLTDSTYAIPPGYVPFQRSPIHYILLGKDGNGGVEVINLTYGGIGTELSPGDTQSIPEGDTLLDGSLETAFFHNTMIISGKDGSFLIGSGLAELSPYTLTHISNVSYETDLYKDEEANAFLLLNKVWEVTYE